MSWLFLLVVESLYAHADGLETEEQREGFCGLLDDAYNDYFIGRFREPLVLDLESKLK